MSELLHYIMAVTWCSRKSLARRFSRTAMQKKIVAMPLIPATIQRGSAQRADLRYAAFGRATWEWWCRRHGVHFVALERALGSGVYEDMSPSFTRWLALESLITEFGYDARVALVDADTMIRWDAPSLFDVADCGFAAVRDSSGRWIRRSITAYEHLFPGVCLPWYEYFNAGVVVLGAAQQPVIARFLEFASSRWSELNAVQKTGLVGSDQTPLNFMVRLMCEVVDFLPREFNFLHCMPMYPALEALERGETTDAAPFYEVVRRRPETLGFIQSAYVWHFTNVVATRYVVMREVWRYVSRHYPGAEISDQ